MRDRAIQGETAQEERGEGDRGDWESDGLRGILEARSYPRQREGEHKLQRERVSEWGRVCGGGCGASTFTGTSILGEGIPPPPLCARGGGAEPAILAEK